MKVLKMFGLAVVAAVASMAFLGVGSASATLICHLGTPTSGGCPEGQLPYSGTVVASSSSKAGGMLDTFTSGFVTVECEGKMEGKVESNGSGAIEAVTWSACKNNIGCETFTAKAESLPWSTSIASSGEMTISNFKFSFSISKGLFCPSSTCIYAAASVVAQVLDSLAATEPNTIHVKKLALKRQAGSSGTCSETGTWSALYSILPTNLHIH